MADSWLTQGGRLERQNVCRSYRIPFVRAAGECLLRPLAQRASSSRFMLDRPHADCFEFNAALHARHPISVHF
ncbi:hypothetical protein AYM40_12590 [Paraburkholderia phytofirmans OLGA172]|uniref:Uncharacterized protein n=1 Tax=Paraburkholderia phytofirmans OLGA172 TaxID=1417228 RepID=A0A167W079_9BURK|nr:hypothetical protein AYM40_12590 [Paraburkholderia phytofirmans OLGA172]